MSAVPNPIEPAAPAPVPAKPTIVPYEPKKGGPWKSLMALAVLGALGYLGYQWLAQPAVDTTVYASVKTMTAAMGSVERTIRVAGQTSARDYANITAPILRGPDSRGTLILSQLVKGGSIVKKGDQIAQIDGQALVDRLDDLRDQVQQAENDVLKREAEQSVEMAQLNQTLRVAKSNWDKANLEFKAAEVRSDVERELLKLSVDEAEARFKQQSSDVSQKRASHAAELKILQLTAGRLKIRLNRSENDLRRYKFTAPIDGLVVMQTIYRGGEMTQISEGEQVMPGQPFMKIVNQATMQVEGNVNQAESGDIRIGQEVRVGFDPFPGLILRGRVSGLNALAISGGRTSSFVRNVPVRVQLLDQDRRIIPDLSAYGDVIIEKAGGVLHVPSSALFEEGGKQFLFIRTPQQQFDKREVSVGLRSHTDVAVTGGLKAGDEVRLN